MTRSRSPFAVAASGAVRSACAWHSDSQFPTRIPTDLTLFTRAMPAARSGAINPLSAASAASLRIADIRMMIDDDPRPRASRDARQSLTVALEKPGRGSLLNHAINSSSAMLYTRLVIGDETLSRTSAFNFCHCAIFSSTIESFIVGPFMAIIGSETHYDRLDKKIPRNMVKGISVSGSRPRMAGATLSDMGHSERGFANASPKSCDS